jgi:hypothetical protein
MYFILLFTADWQLDLWQAGTPAVYRINQEASQAGVTTARSHHYIAW